MKIRFVIPLIPGLIGKRAATMGGTVTAPRVQFDVVLDDDQQREALIEYLGEIGAEYVMDDPTDAPGLSG